MGSARIKCLHCDLEEVRGPFELWFHHLQGRIMDTDLTDEACRAYCTSPVPVAATWTTPALITLLLISGKHEARASAEGKRGENGVGPWGKWVAMGIRDTVRRGLEGRPKGSEDQLRSEGRNLGQSTGIIGTWARRAQQPGSGISIFKVWTFPGTASTPCQGKWQILF